MRKAVYGASCVAAAALFAWWSAIAYADRGYWAVGGEYGALLLPLLVAVVEGVARDAAEERARRARRAGRPRRRR